MTQSVKEYFESEVKRLVGEARDLTEKASRENRALSADERSSVESKITETNGLKQRIAEIEDNDRLVAAIESASGIAEAEKSEAPEDALSVGEAFVRSAGYKNLMTHGLTGAAWSSGPVEINMKAAARTLGLKLTDVDGNTVESITGAGGTLPLNPQIARGPVPLVEQRLTIADLFAQGQATANSLVYLEETSVTPGVLNKAYTVSGGASTAAAVLTSEGVAKPAAYIDFTKRTANVEKLAAFLPISEEMLEDEPQISSYINNRLSIFVREAEERRLLTKLQQAGIGTAGFAEVGGSNVFDSVMAGITAARIEGGMEPDALLISPLDFAKMSVTKNSFGYFSGGPYGAPSNAPWGLRTVVTAAVADGSPIVGAFREGAQVWRKGGLTVESSNSHQDYFRKNLVALRAEERLALTVYRPSAFQTLFTTS
jgi:HK97 family phage major capsid protein